MPEPIDFGDPAELAGFRARVRDWLETVPRPAREPDEPIPVHLTRWHRFLYDAGWVGLDVPAEYGGHGLTAHHAVVVSEELGRVGAPGIPRIGYLAQALLRYGSDQQRHDLLPRMLSGRDVWCQGFSEPSAGSDLAGLRTAARPNGRGFRVSGQKLWTSYAQYSNLCLLLARTDEHGPRHTSISAFALPLDRPGVVVRPLTAANGHDEFCELFLDDVELDRDDMIGEPGQGWPLAMTTVAYERNALDTAHLSRYRQVVTGLAERARESAPSWRREVGRRLVEVETLAAHSRRRVAERRTVPAGADASVDKLLMTSTEQRLYDTALRMSPGQLLKRTDADFADYLYSRAASVYGGTSQIQRNIIAKRILGLRSDGDR